jgi:hypothetical protein
MECDADGDDYRPSSTMFPGQQAIRPDLARLREAIRATKRDIAARKNVEEDLQRLIPGATLVGTTGFGDAIIRRMK